MSTTTCWASGATGGPVLATTNGGSSLSLAQYPTVYNGNLNAVDCVTISRCWAVGASAMINVYLAPCM